MGSPNGRFTVKVLRVTVEIVWYVQILGFLLGLGTTISALIGAGDPVVLPLHFELDADVYEIDVGELGRDATIRSPAGLLEIIEPAEGVALGLGLFHLLGMAVGLAIWWQIRKIVRSLASEEPFEPDNVRRIRIVAFAVLGWELVRAGHAYGWTFHLAERAVTEGISVLPVPRPDLGLGGLDFGLLLAGLALLVLAEVFRVGSAIRDDQRLTV